MLTVRDQDKMDLKRFGPFYADNDNTVNRTRTKPETEIRTQ